VTDEKKRAIFEELARILETPRQAEDEVTTREYADFSGCTQRRAYTQLIQAAADGRMTKRKVLVDCNQCWAFKLEKTDTDNRSGNRSGDAV